MSVAPSDSAPPIDLLDNSPCVAAHFNGHDHEGGFTTDKISGTHYVTFPAICDSGGKTGAHAIAHFGKDWINIEGWGRVGSRKLSCLTKTVNPANHFSMPK